MNVNSILILDFKIMFIELHQLWMKLHGLTNVIETSRNSANQNLLVKSFTAKTETMLCIICTWILLIKFGFSNEP